MLEASVDEVEALVGAVPGGPDDAPEATAHATASAATDRLSVVSQEMRSRVDEPRQVVVPPASLQVAKHVPLRLPSRHGRRAKSRGVRGGDESDGHDDG